MSFGKERKETVLSRDGTSRSFMNSVSKSGSCELPTASPILSKEHDSFDLQTATKAATAAATKAAVPIVVIDSTEPESACSPNCFLYPIGSTLYTTFIPLISSQSAPSNEDGEERELPDTVTLLATPDQAKILAELEAESGMHLALVFRGSAEQAAEFIEAQDSLLKDLYAETEKEMETNRSEAEQNQMVGEGEVD